MGDDSAERERERKRERAGETNIIRTISYIMHRQKASFVLINRVRKKISIVIYAECRVIRFPDGCRFYSI